MSGEHADARRLLLRIAGATTLVSLVWAAWGPLVSSIGDTIRLQPLAYTERRVRKLGPFYSSVLRLRTQVGPDEPLALITADANVDAALFANYYLYPHPLRIYPGRAAYRNSAADPSRPRTLVEVGDLVERTTYGEMRNRELRTQPRLSTALPLSEPRRRFVIPIAASIDGPFPDTYVLEGTMQNQGESAAMVEIQFFPSDRTSRITIPPRSSFGWYDLIYQQFGVMQIGWLEVRSSEPVAGVFAFVNRGRSDVVSLPLDVHAGPQLAGSVSGRDTKLWLLNLRNQPVTAGIGSDAITVNAHDLVARPLSGPIPVIRAEGIYAFASTRNEEGLTRFLWPR